MPLDGSFKGLREGYLERGFKASGEDVRICGRHVVGRGLRLRG